MYIKDAASEAAPKRMRTAGTYTGAAGGGGGSSYPGSGASRCALCPVQLRSRQELSEIPQHSCSLSGAA